MARHKVLAEWEGKARFKVKLIDGLYGIEVQMSHGEHALMNSSKTDEALLALGALLRDGDVALIHRTKKPNDEPK